MKLLATLALAFAASTLPSHADPDPAAAAKPELGYVIQSHHQTVAILPANPARALNITSDNITDDRTTGTTICSGDVKIVVDVPGQTPVTIAGDELTLIAQK